MAQYKLHGTVAEVIVDNPPVNALGTAARIGLLNGIQKALADPSVRSIVISGTGQTFPSGADIAEFSTGNQFIPPSIPEICSAVENSTKPVIAAVHGTVLGGGNELCISAHYRVANKKTWFGFPEVTLGILPAATGTQRFPRLCGLKVALDLIPSGRRFGVAEAKAIGMLDLIAEKDHVAEAIKFAKTVEGRFLEGRRVSGMKVKDAHLADELHQAAVMKAKKTQRDMIAPLMCIKAVMASVEVPYDQGVLVEEKLAQVLFSSGQAQALQYAFFADKAAPKWRLPSGASFKDYKGQKIKSGAVIGAGTMGTGITMAMLNVGIPVVLVEQNKQFLDKGVSAVKALYAGSVQRKLLTKQQAEMILSQLTPTVDITQVANADIVIEAVFEDLALKQEMFKKLDSVCKPDAILATNTSYLSIDKIAAVTSRPDKVIGTHFFVPAYYMKVLENVFHPKVSPQTVAAAMSFGKQIGKISVLVGTCDGFVGNRMLTKYGSEAGFLLEEGCLPQQVDRVMEEFGFPMGVFKVSDLSGLDIGWRSRMDRAKALGKKLEHIRYVNGVRTSYLSDVLCEQGRFGRKTGKGWFKYEKAGAKEALADPSVENLITQYSAKEGITRRHVRDQEVLERCVYSMINESFKILEEGVAAKPEDVDTIWLLGYGFPRHRGGPMFYANQVGLDRIYARVCHYYEQDPCSPHWVPSKLLERLAKRNIPMQDWMKHVQRDTSKL